MANILSLAPKPSIKEELRQDAIACLREALDLACKGEIESLVLIMKHSDNEWSEKHTGVDGFPEAIGRLEIVKHNWIEDYTHIQHTCEKP